MDRIEQQRRRRLEIAGQSRRTTERLAADLDQRTADRVHGAIAATDEVMTVEEACSRIGGVPQTVVKGTGTDDQADSEPRRSENPFQIEADDE